MPFQKRRIGLIVPGLFWSLFWTVLFFGRHVENAQRHFQDPDGPSSRAIVGNTYTDQYLGYSLKFPANWGARVNQKIQGGLVDLILMGPPTLTSTTPPSVGFANLSITHARKGYLTLEALWGTKRSELEYTSSVSVLTDRFYDRDSIPAGEVVALFSDGNHEARMNWLAFERKGVVVTLIFTSLAADSNASVEFQAIDSSLTFL